MAPCDEVNSCISNPTSPATMVNSDEGVVTVAVSRKLQKGQSPDMKIQELESNKEVSTSSIISRKTSQGPNNADTALQSDKGHISSVKPENVSQSSCTGVLALVPSQEGRTPSVIPKKAPQPPNSSVHSLPSCHEGRIHSVVRGSDDGFNWRKYGQKNVRGNEYIRSYYKCTYPNCQVKRQVERSHDGQITNTVYFGQHDHPKPQANIPLAVGFVVSIVNERSAEPSVTSPNDKLCNVDVKSPIKNECIAVATSDDVKSALSQPNRRTNEIDNHDVPDSKRHKKNNLDAKLVDRSTTEQRVVKTVSEVDSVNDGYRWRKYGQKLVKGNPNPRSYYRCSSPGCPAKKHVERASHDPKTVIATYEGHHDHDMPLGRTATHNTAPLDKETGTKSRKNNAVCLDMVLHMSSDPLGTSPGTEAREVLQIESGPVNKADEQRNGESGIKSEAHDAVSPNMAAQPSLGNGNQSNKVKNIHSGPKPEETDMIGTETDGPEARSNGKPEGINNLSTGSISKEQPTPNAELLHTENPSKVLQNDEAD